MDQQQSSSRDDESDGGTNQQQQQPQSSRPAGDDTWGVGSSTALDRLRERNYRGRRGGQHGDGRPASE